MPKFDLIYNCDASPSIGVGHVFRGIDIVNQFCSSNRSSKVAIRGNFDFALIPKIRRSLSQRAVILESNDVSESFMTLIDTMFYPGSQKINVDYFRHYRKYCDCLIHLWDAMEYGVPAEVDVVFNHLPYVKLTEDFSAEVFTGFDYLPVPNRFYETSDYNPESGYVLSIIGSTTSPERIIPYLEYLANQRYASIPRVLLSPSISADIKDEFIKTFPTIQFHQHLIDILSIMKDASAIVTTYGNTTFQSLAAKIPVFTIAFQDFQMQYGMALENYGLTKNLGFIDDINTDKAKQLIDRQHLTEMHKKQSQIFRTPGLDNIVAILTNKLKGLKSR